MKCHFQEILFFTNRTTRNLVISNYDLVEGCKTLLGYKITFHLCTLNFNTNMISPELHSITKRLYEFASDRTHSLQI